MENDLGTRSSSSHDFIVLVQESEGNKGVVLPGAASYVDCTVVERMEAGDHWLVYATIDFGKVVDAGAVSAVHHRKVGTNY